MNIANQYICDLNPYQPGVPMDEVARVYNLNLSSIVKLASNENPLGPSPKALAAIRDASSAVHRYPEQHRLVNALAEHYGIKPSMVAIGSGSNDILDLIARTYLNDGDEAISAQYSFAVYQIATQSAGATNVVVPAKDYGHDLEAMAAAVTPATKVVWLVNPNNPTGTFLPHAAVKRFIEQLPASVIVVLDEAYCEYLESADQANSISWLAEHPNLVLVRTFSKIYGLAGLRAGYGIAAPEIIELLNRVRLPFNVSTLALAGATAALADQEFVARSREVNAQERSLLLQKLAELHLECLPAYGNFVTFRVADAAATNKALLQRGVITRPLAGYGMTDWIRVTVGLPDENMLFIQSLRASL